MKLFFLFPPSQRNVILINKLGLRKLRRSKEKLKCVTIGKQSKENKILKLHEDSSVRV